MDRFFVSSDFNEKEIWINGEEAHHMLNVKRHKAGDSVILFNGEGAECVGEIHEVCHERMPHNKKARISIKSTKNVNKEIGFEITVAVSVPKGKRSDFIIQKCSELGVKEIIPIITERCVVKVDSGHKLEKWKRIAVEASKQCGRNMITEISDVMPFQSLIDMIRSFELSIIFSNNETAKGTKEIFKKASGIKNVLCIIGPEGGFSTAEIEQAQNAGCKIAILTPQVLRVETAVIAVVSMLIYEYTFTA